MNKNRAMSRTEFTNIEAAMAKLSKQKPMTGRETTIGAAEEHDFNVSQSERNNYVFQTEYNYWRSQGQANIVAHRKAVDYYRKFTSKEITVDWVQAADLQASVDPIGEKEDQINFNQIVRLVLKDLTDRQQEFFCMILVQQDLDQFLDDDLYDLVESHTKGERPETVKEIADLMGLRLNSINVCTPLTKSRQRIKKVFEDLGFIPESLKQIMGALA